MRRVLLLLALCCCFSTVGSAQSVTARLLWDQPAPSLTDAQAYVYRSYFDGAITGTIVKPTCTGTVSPFVCTLVFALPIGTHTVALTAGGSTVESARSPVLTFPLSPTSPTNLRVSE